MRSVLFLVIYAMIAISAETACSADRTYLSASIGMASVDDYGITESESGTHIKLDYDKAIPISVAMGKRTDNISRGEIELSYQKNDLDNSIVSGFDNVSVKGDISSLALLANGYYDFITSGAIAPYFCVGLGLAEVSINDVSVRIPNPDSTQAVPLSDTVYEFDDDDIVLAYQVGAGVGYTISSNLIIDLKYRYFATSKAKFDNTKLKITSQNFYVGVRFGF